MRTSIWDKVVDGIKQQARNLYYRAEAAAKKSYDYVYTNRKVITGAVLAVAVGYYFIIAAIQMAAYLLVGAAAAYVGYRVWDAVSKNPNAGNAPQVGLSVVGDLCLSAMSATYGYFSNLMTRLSLDQGSHADVTPGQTRPGFNSNSTARFHKKTGSRPQSSRDRDNVVDSTPPSADELARSTPVYPPSHGKSAFSASTPQYRK